MRYSLFSCLCWGWNSPIWLSCRRLRPRFKENTTWQQLNDQDCISTAGHSIHHSCRSSLARLHAKKEPHFGKIKAGDIRYSILPSTKSSAARTIQMSWFQLLKECLTKAMIFTGWEYREVRATLQAVWYLLLGVVFNALPVHIFACNDGFQSAGVQILQEVEEGPHFATC